MQQEAGKALLGLVPKVTKPTTIKDFRPITLCNVCNKLVNKVIANMIKLLLMEIVSYRAWIMS